MDLGLVPDQVKGCDLLVSLEGPFGAFDDDPASVVATHDIHCNSHKIGKTRRANGAALKPERL